MLTTTQPHSIMTQATTNELITKSKARQVFEFVQANPGLTTQQIGDRLGIPPHHVGATISVDCRRGLYSRSKVYDRSLSRLVYTIYPAVTDYSMAAPYSYAQKRMKKQRNPARNKGDKTNSVNAATRLIEDLKKYDTQQARPAVINQPVPTKEDVFPPTPKKNNVDALLDMVDELTYKEFREFKERFNNRFA